MHKETSRHGVADNGNFGSWGLTEGERARRLIEKPRIVAILNRVFPNQHVFGELTAEALRLSEQWPKVKDALAAEESADPQMALAIEKISLIGLAGVADEMEVRWGNAVGRDEFDQSETLVDAEKREAEYWKKVSEVCEYAMATERTFPTP